MANRGIPLAVIHGWAADSHFTAPLASLLPGRQICFLNQPGYGGSPAGTTLTPATLDETCELLTALLPGRCDLLGWSSGALLAIRCCALFPQRFRRLITVCGSPRFPQDPNWPGLPYRLVLRVLRNFTASRHRKLLELFFRLQSDNPRYSPAVRAFIRECRAAQAPVSFAVLRTGLEMTLHADLRADLAHLKLPRLHLLGGDDRLVDARVAPQLTLGGGRAVVIPGAGHLPYLTHPAEFSKLLRDFCEGDQIS